MSKLAKATLGLMIATILSKILGFGRDLALASSYGASSYSDAYLIASTIPTIIFASIGSAISTSYIPLYCEINEKFDENRAKKFTNNLTNTILIITTLVTIIGLVFTKPIVKLFAVGFTGETLNLTINFTRILFLGLTAIGLNYVLRGYLQIKENFLVPGFISIPYNIIIIGSIFISVKTNIYVLVVGTLIAIISQALYQIPFAKRKGFKYKPYLDIKDEYLKKMMHLITPVFIGVSVNQINTLIDRTLASTLAEGSISALNYANKLNGFVMALFVTTIATVIYPMLSQYISKNNNEKFKEAIKSSINSMTLIIIPITIGAMIFATPIVKILFERGSFDSRATTMTATSLFYYSIGMIGFGLRDILSRIFYSLQDTKTPMINASIAVIINIILNFILVKHMSYAGLALSTSISSIVCIGLLFTSLKKKIGYFHEDKIFSVIIKSFIASVIMGVLCKVIYNSLTNILGIKFVGLAISLFISVLCGALLYSILVKLLRIEEFDMLLIKLKSKFIRKK